MSHLCEIIQQIILSQRQLGSEKNVAREILYNGLLYKCIIMTKGLITNHQSFSFGPVQTKNVILLIISSLLLCRWQPFVLLLDHLGLLFPCVTQWWNWLQRRFQRLFAVLSGKKLWEKVTSCLWSVRGTLVPLCFPFSLTSAIILFLHFFLLCTFPEVMERGSGAGKKQ